MMTFEEAIAEFATAARNAGVDIDAFRIMWSTQGEWGKTPRSIVQQTLVEQGVIVRHKNNNYVRYSWAPDN